MKKILRKHWLMNIFISVSLLGFLYLELMGFFLKEPDTSKIPELYRNPEYCDENVGCGLWRAGGGGFCGNMYYVNQFGFGQKSIISSCVCNLTTHKCGSPS